MGIGRSEMIKRFVKLQLGSLFLLLLFLLSGCQDTSDLTFRAVVKGQLPGGMNSRTVMPQEGYAAPGYYVATLTSKVGSKTYSGATSDISEGIVIDGISAGSYTLKVDGYASESDRTWMMTGSINADIYYSTTMEFTVPIDVISSGDGLTSTVAIDIDWSGTSKRIDTVELYVSDSPDSSTLETWTKVATQEIESVDSNPGRMSFGQQVPVSPEKFMKFLYYENGQCIGYSEPELAHFYSGQVATTSVPSRYVYDDANNPFRLALNITDINLSYGDDDTSLVLSWVNPYVYDKIVITCWKTAQEAYKAPLEIDKDTVSQYLDTDSQRMRVAFTDLEKETEYTFEIYVVHSTGQHSEHALKSLATATLVKTITLKNSLSLDEQKHFTPGMSCTVSAEYSPSDATLGDGFIWKSSDTAIATVEALNTTQAKVTAVGSGKVVITCIAPVGTAQAIENVLVSFNSPTGLTAEPVEKGVSLTWQDNNSSISGYRVYRSKDSGSYVQIAEVAAGTKAYSDTQVQSGGSYSYKVAAYGTIDEIECESLSEASVVVAIKNPTISIVLPEAPSDISAVFSQYSGTTFFADEELVVELTEPIASANHYRWYLNGTQLVAGDYAAVKSIIISKDTNGINLTQVAPMQDLMLVVTVGDMDFSSTLRVYMVDKEQIVDVSEIQLSAPARITYGEPQNVAATILPTDATVKNLTWSSSDESVASIDREGLVTVHKSGSVRITATSEVSNVSATTGEIDCYVPVATVEIQTPVRNYVFVEGFNGYKQIQLSAKVLSVAGTSIAATNTAIMWESSDTAIAQIDSTGTVTAVGDGFVTITVRSDEDHSITATIDIVSAVGQLAKNGTSVTSKSEVATTGAGFDGNNYTFSISYPSLDVSKLGYTYAWTLADGFNEDGSTKGEDSDRGSAGIRLRLTGELTNFSVNLNRQANAGKPYLVAKLLNADGVVVMQTWCRVVP